MTGPSRELSLPQSLTVTSIESAPDAGMLYLQEVSYPTVLVDKPASRSGPNCPFRVRANYYEKKGYAKVTTCDDVHTCTSSAAQPASQDIKRAEASRLKFLVEAVPKHMTVAEDTSTKLIIETVKEKYGQDIALRQAQKVKALLCPKSREICQRCGKAHARSVRCSRIRLSRSNQASGVNAMASNESTQIDWEADGDTIQLSDQAISRNEIPTLQHNGTADTNVVDPRLQYSSVTRPEDSATHVQTVPTMVDPNLMLQSHQQSLPLNGVQTQQLAISNPVRVPMGTPIRGVATNPQSSRTPRETRLEAARLMQSAARLMQEAARLNAEAARLTASVANV